MLENFRRAFSPGPTDCPPVSEDGSNHTVTPFDQLLQSLSGNFCFCYLYKIAIFSKLNTVQYCVGLRSSQPSTSISCNFISSSAFAPSFEFAASPTMHLDNHFDPVYRATSKWPIGHFRVAPSLCLKARLRAKPMI